MVEVRPSALPKLAECRCYQGKPGSSPEAARGTLLDGIIRRAWMGEPVPGDLSDEDAAAVQWALVQLASLHVGGDKSEVLTDEAQLRAVVPVAGVQAGTMDACCPAQQWLVDFKTGQMRDYKGQMAAYSLSCMDEFFADTWTAHLLFVDQQRCVSHFFTREDAEALVQGIVSAPQEPRCCEYCGWCAAFESCPAVQAARAEVMAQELPVATPAVLSRGELPPVLEALVEDEAGAHAFLSKLKVVNDWAELLRKRLRDGLGERKSAFFQRVVVSGRRVVSPRDLAGLVPPEQVLEACAMLPLKKAQEVLAAHDEHAVLPEEFITTMGGSVALKLKTIKSSTNKN